MSISKNILLSKFALDERTVHLDSIDADVVVRNFTQKESDGFVKASVDGLDSNGDPIVNIDKSINVKYLKVSEALVEPKLTVEELQGMAGAGKFIKEVLEAIGEGEEGNEN